VSRRAAWLLALPFLGLLLGPVGWQLLTSIWPGGELTRAWPSHLTLDHYVAVLARGDFTAALGNSVLVATATTLLSLALAAPAAFAVATLRVRGRSLLLGAALAVSMFPPIATVSPLYLALRSVGLLDRLPALVLPYATFSLPLALWLLSTTFRELPGELYEAARMDGCSSWQAFRRVLLPLAAPGLGTAAVVVFVTAWNELLYALTFVSSPEHRTVPVALALLAGEHRDPWAEIAAASVVATLPLVAVVVALQRRVVAGLTAGAVKG
jgi:multiple sugar transport system permease protein